MRVMIKFHSVIPVWMTLNFLMFDCLSALRVWPSYCSLYLAYLLLFMFDLPSVLHAWPTFSSSCLTFLLFSMLGLPSALHIWPSFWSSCLAYLLLFIFGLPSVPYAWPPSVPYYVRLSFCPSLCPTFRLLIVWLVPCTPGQWRKVLCRREEHHVPCASQAGVGHHLQPPPPAWGTEVRVSHHSILHEEHIPLCLEACSSILQSVVEHGKQF